jgi:hypothetical protein
MRAKIAVALCYPKEASFLVGLGGNLSGRAMGGEGWMLEKRRVERGNTRTRKRKRN